MNVFLLMIPSGIAKTILDRKQTLFNSLGKDIYIVKGFSYHVGIDRTGFVATLEETTRKNKVTIELPNALADKFLLLQLNRTPIEIEVKE